MPWQYFCGRYTSLLILTYMILINIDMAKRLFGFYGHNTLVIVDTGYSYQDEIKAVKVIFKSSSSHLSECNFNPIHTIL